MNVPDGFKRLAAESGSTPNRVRARLLAEVRLRRTPTPWWPWAAATALAGAVIAVLIFGPIKWTRKPRRPPVVAPAAIAKTSAPARQQTHPAISVVARKPAIVRRKTPPPAPTLTPFMALPGADMLAPIEDERIVRVQMERGMLRELGFLNIEARDQSLVQADFVLGQDGLARAVRFVRY